MTKTENQTECQPQVGSDAGLCPSEFERNQAYMIEHGLPVKNRYAEGWCGGKYFCIQVAPGETLTQLKKHFRETVGHDRIQVRRWYWA